MSSFSRVLLKIFKFLASIQLAIIVLTSLAVMSAIGTIYEARYDATYAQKMIYHSPLMYFILALLCVNLLNVMIDRWPWRRHHAGFISAHIGIIVLILGSLWTRLEGIDGSIAFDIGQSNRYVVLPQTEFTVFASFIDGNHKAIYQNRTDFLLNPPKKNPVETIVANKKLIIKDFYPFALRSEKISPTQDVTDGPALRVQLENPNVNMTQWITKAAGVPYETFDLGPAKIILADKLAKYTWAGGNEIVFFPLDGEKVRYEIYTKSKNGLTQKGQMKVTEKIETGWMGLSLRLLKYHLNASRIFEYTPKERPTPATVSAVQFEYDGKDYWIGLNSNIRLFSDFTMYVVSYRNALIDIGFDIRLDKFNVGRYQGTNRAKSYESEVTVEGAWQAKISMNEPLKYNGFTFYQASFQEDSSGAATTSILSVNRDPGRATKYFGSFLIVLGIILMFYFKKSRFAFMSKSEKPNEGKN